MTLLSKPSAVDGLDAVSVSCEQLVTILARGSKREYHANCTKTVESVMRLARQVGGIKSGGGAPRGRITNLALNGRPALHFAVPTGKNLLNVMSLNVFLVHVGDADFSRVLPAELDRSPRTAGRIKVMAFPPLGIQTLAPIVRQHGHAVRMFDRCEGRVDSAAETAADILASFRFAARLELDTFGFNRLCAYRGTPLWQEYVERGIIDDERDWQEWFKCTDIDPTALPGPEVNRLRMKGYARLFASRLCRRPVKTFKLLRAFGRHMKRTDLLELLARPALSRMLRSVNSTNSRAWA